MTEADGRCEDDLRGTRGPQELPVVVHDPQLHGRMKDRRLLSPDRSICIDLAGARAKAAGEARVALSRSVASGALPCPISMTLLLEIMRQSSDSALRSARRMDELNLRVGFLPDPIVFQLELDRCFTRLLGDVPRPWSAATVRGPPAFFLTLLGKLEFPASSPGSTPDRWRPAWRLRELAGR